MGTSDVEMARWRNALVAVAATVRAADSVGHTVILPSLTPCAITVQTVSDAGKSCAGTDLVVVRGVDADGWPFRMFLAPDEMLDLLDNDGKAA